MHLTADERATLRHCEAVIETAHRHFEAAADALCAIKVKGLYRLHHKSFADYCRDRWGFGLAHGKRFVAAACVLADLREADSETAPRGAILPENERQCRALAALPPAERRLAWAGAVGEADGRQPTAAQVQAAAARVTGGLAAAVRQEEEREEAEAALIDDAERRERVGRALRCLRKARRQLEPIEDARGAVAAVEKAMELARGLAG